MIGALRHSLPTAGTPAVTNGSRVSPGRTGTGVTDPARVLGVVLGALAPSRSGHPMHPLLTPPGLVADGPMARFRSPTYAAARARRDGAGGR